MYIMKCDRCGKEQEIKSLLPFFGAKEEAPTPGRKFSLMQLDEYREITLCQDCEAALEEWLDYGAARGIGQWRNSGKGRFTWEELK